jgi:hypothetical protein
MDPYPDKHGSAVILGWLDPGGQNDSRREKSGEIYCFEQCCGSALVSMRIRIQGSKPMRIRIRVLVKSQKVKFFMKNNVGIR